MIIWTRDFAEGLRGENMIGTISEFKYPYISEVFKYPYSSEVRFEVSHYPYKCYILDIPTDITALESANLTKFFLWIQGKREQEHFEMFIKEHCIERLFKEMKI